MLTFNVCDKMVSTVIDQDESFYPAEVGKQKRRLRNLG